MAIRDYTLTADEKLEIIRRLKGCRQSGGPGGLERVAEAIRPKSSMSAELLRDLCQGRAPQMPIAAWRKISKALDKLEVRS